MAVRSILNNKDRELILETKNLLEELLETQEILEDRDLMMRIKEAEKEIKGGKGRPLGDFVNELRANPDVKSG